MRKLRFLFVLLAMVSLASCNFKDEAVIRYEVKSENPNECYVAEIVPGNVSSNPNEFFFDHNKKAKVDRLVISGSRNAILTSMTWPSGLLDYKNVCYDIPLSDELISWVIKFPKKRNKPSNDELKKICNDFIKNAGFSIDTLYKPSYRLIISDIERFKKESNATKTMQYVYSGGIFSQTIYTKKNLVTVNLNTYKEGVIQDVNLLALGLRDFHHIPTLNEVDSIYANDKVFFKPEFYSGQKSVEEVNEMLSEYGLSLEPTGKEKMVITFSTDKTIESAKLFESKSYTNKFFAVLFVGILFCVFATMHVSKKEALAPKSKSVIRVGSAILLWVLAALCFLLFISIFGIAALFTEAELHDLNWNDYLINSRSLATLALGFIFTATGISVFNYRKSYYTISGKIPRVLFTICVFGLMFNIIENIINSDFDLVGPLFVCIALGGMMRKQKIENNC